MTDWIDTVPPMGNPPKTKDDPPKASYSYETGPEGHRDCDHAYDFCQYTPDNRFHAKAELTAPVVTIPAPDPKTDEPTAFYVSVIDRGRTALAAGPYDTHAEAIAEVEAVKAAAEKATAGRSVFYAWGTAGFRSPREEAPIGVMNKAGIWPPK
jgi:hypothetical protein